MLAVPLDVTDPASVDAMLERVTDELGPVDVLVNNAGVCFHRPALEVPEHEWREVFDVNVDGVWRCARAVGAQMVERGTGSIVNVGSMSATIVNRPQMQPAYNASKAAVHHLTRSLAAEWAPHGVRVNALAPGYMKTEMSPVDEPRFRRHWIEDAPMQRAANARGARPVAALPGLRRVELRDRIGARRRWRLHALVKVVRSKEIVTKLLQSQRPVPMYRCNSSPEQGSTP